MLLALGAVVFTGLFTFHLRNVAPSQYADRDDALITLSHARNFVEYGFIGVSPSGERIAGYSTPAQFLTAAAVYAVAPFDYHVFFRWQTRIGTLVLGAVFAALFAGSAQIRTSTMATMFAGLAIVLSAQILASSTAFLWWHASGMENVYKSVALAVLLYALDFMLRRGRIAWPVIALIPLAAITRIDAVVPVGMLLAAFVVLWYLRHRDARALMLAAAGLCLWLVFMIGSHQYFGQWTPNTAAAQGISVGTRVAVAAHAPFHAFLDYRAWFIDVGSKLFAFQLLWLLPLAWYMRRHPVAMCRASLIAAGTGACVLQFALFGPARMDQVRTVTELALYATASVPFVLLGARRFSAKHFAVGLMVMASSVAFTMHAPPHAREIGWGTSGFEAVADQFDRIADGQDIPRAMVANPDLGAVSWRKHFNVLDLGRLGSVVIPRAPAPGYYTAAIAMPDIIELHAPWSCGYPDLFGASGFASQYVRVTLPIPTDQSCAGATGNRPAFWLRKDITKDSRSAERVFLDRFRKTLDVALVRQELEICVTRPEPRPCGYVGRTLFRFAPELRQSGRAEAVEALLRDDPRLRIEHAFFTSSSDPTWWESLDLNHF